MISVLLPTTGRPEMALETLESLFDTRGNHSLEFALAIDADKITHKQVLKLFRAKGANFQISWCGEYRGCSKAWNDAYALTNGDPIVLAADDLIFHPGCLDAALDKMKELPPEGGLVGFNDTQTDGTNYATHYMMSRWFIDNCLGGRVAWDDYKHSFNDVEATERAKRAGRFVYAPNAIVEHRHWIHGTRLQDATDTRFLGEHMASAIKYNERAAAGFPD